MKPDKTYTVLFEHAEAGLAEHSAPIALEWAFRGHRAIVMAPASELPGVRNAHKTRQKHQGRITFKAFEEHGIKWNRIHAMLNIIPGEPGPAFRDITSPCNIPRVTINHGLTDKQTTFPADYIGNGAGYANVLFACGPAMFKGSWEQYSKKWPEILHSLKIIPVGSPKTDILFDNTYQRDVVLQSLRLDPSKPTVLYAPTYQKEASLERHGIDIIRTLAAMPVNVIVRPHHLSTKQGWTVRLRALEPEHTNLRVMESSSNPLFVAADIMVSDASGACFEYMLQNKPVIFFDVPDFFKKHGREGVGFWGRNAGIIVKNTSKLRSAVNFALSHPANKSAERKKIIKNLVYRRGGAAVKAVDTLLGLIEGRIEYPSWGPRQCLRQDILMNACISERLERCSCETKSVALFGAGAHTIRLLDFIKKASKNGKRMPAIPCIIDDHAKPGETMDNIPVIKPEAASPDSFDTIILSTDYHQALFKKRCKQIFGPAMPTIDLYEPFPWHRPSKDANDLQ